ncbi:hypothetical protein FQN49_003430 [Arthroderma sp. PD_2]|nr:hypothetical protein FQN49_003430 [Arthroderma sp. PD_2]
MPLLPKSSYFGSVPNIRNVRAISTCSNQYLANLLNTKIAKACTPHWKSRGPQNLALISQSEYSLSTLVSRFRSRNCPPAWSQGSGMDKDLLAAVTASMKEAERSQSKLQKCKSSVVDLTGDSDGDASPQLKNGQHVSDEVDSDAELERAIQLSMQSQECPPEHIAESERPKERANNESKTPGSGFGIPGIDRKKQEEERLARLAKKRKAGEESPAPSTARPFKVSRQQPSAQRPTLSKTSTRNISTASPVAMSTEPSVQFPEGVVKKTWALRCERGNDIKIEEVFQSSDLELAVLSSFMWDMDWLLMKFTNQKTRFLFIMGAKGEDKQAQLLEETASMPRIRLCFPSMEGEINCMHSKLMLLFHPTYLRIVVPTANLDPYDWGEKGGLLENMVFLIDLPRKQDSEAESDETTTFRDELVYFLKASNMNEKIIDKMLQFDFGKTAKYAFIHTIGGSHIDSHERTGHCGLGTAVKSLGLQVSRPLKLDYVASSIGSLTSNFMRNLYLAAQGDDGSKQLSTRAGKASSKASNAASADTEEWRDRINVYFPSRETVRESRGGVSGAGTLCFMSKWYNSASFPRHVMRNNRSVREGVLMHSKILFVRPEGDPIKRPDDSLCRGWAYVGSANLSESAWGRLVIDRKTKQAKLNCRNWECGVLVPVEASDTARTPGGELDTVFGDTVPVPMQVPGDEYADGEQPWFYLEHY